MKIEKATVRDFCRIQFAEVRPESAVFVIGGKNAQGKSSLIAALIAGLGGKKFLPDMPVRKGAERAETTIETGEFTIRQYVTKDGRYALQVKRKDGAVYPNGQTFLDQFYNRLSFDPLGFLRLKEREQVDTLQRALGLDFMDLDLKRSNLYEKRTDVNRELKSAEAELRTIEYDANAPKEERSVTELTAELDKASEANQAKAAADKRVEAAADSIRRDRDRLEELEAEVKRLKDGIKEKETALKGFEKTAASLKFVDTAPIVEQINSLEALNAAARSNLRYDALAAQVTKTRTESERLTAEIEKVDAEKQKQVAAAKFPVEGLTWEGDALYLAGVPFAQASQAEQLRVSLAVAFALKSELRVFFSREGALFDPDTLQVLKEEAERAGVQIILERVGEDENTSVVIEDGVIRGQDAPVTPENMLDGIEPA